MTKRWWFWILMGGGLLLFLFLIRTILLPFVLGIMVAYLLDPAADKFQRCNVSRAFSVTLLTVAFFSSIALLAVLVVPLLVGQLSDLLAALPEYAVAFDRKYEPVLSGWMGELPASQMEHIKTAVGNFSGVMVTYMGNFAAGVFQSGMAIFNVLSLILITPVVAFYLLRDWDELVAHVDGLLPRKHVETIREQCAIIDATLAGFVRGQLTVCLLLGLYYAIGLTLVGLKFGFIIGLITGFLVIFPYVGLLVGMSIGMAAAFFQFDQWHDIGLVLAVFVTGQILEGNFVTPKLVGERVGLHPVWIIFGMLAGAALFGFVGILLAVPATAVIGVLIRFATAQYLKSPYYQ
jgi:predicted PurR-regulated permease PerM